MLEPEDHVGHQHARGTEAQQRRRVTRPVLIFAGVHAGKPVEESLDGTQPLPRAVEHADEVQADGFRDRQ